MKRTFVLISGVLLLVIGGTSMVTPIPGGFIMLSSGSVLLICASPWFRRCLQLFRTRSVLLNKVMTWMENKMGERIGQVLKLTQPGYEPKPGDHGN